MKEKVKVLKENMATFEEWGNPKYKSFLEHCLKHYPNISDKQLKSIEINFYQLQKYLNKNSESSNGSKFLKKLINSSNDTIISNNKDLSFNKIFDKEVNEENIYNYFKPIYEKLKDDCDNCAELKSWDDIWTEIHDKYEDDDDKIEELLDEIKDTDAEDIYDEKIKEDKLITVLPYFTYGYCYFGCLQYYTYKGENYLVGGVCDMANEEGGYIEIYEADKITKDSFKKNFRQIIKEYLYVEHTDVL